MTNLITPKLDGLLQRMINRLITLPPSVKFDLCEKIKNLSEKQKRILYIMLHDESLTQQIVFEFAAQNDPNFRLNIQHIIQQNEQDALRAKEEQEHDVEIEVALQEIDNL